MKSIYPGMIDSVFSFENALDPLVGTTFAVPQIPSGDPQGQEVTVEYIENTPPATVSMTVEGGNRVDASEDLVAPFEVLATINTIGEKSIRVNMGRYEFVRLNLGTLTGVGRDVSGKLKR